MYSYYCSVSGCCVQFLTKDHVTIIIIIIKL